MKILTIKRCAYALMLLLLIQFFNCIIKNNTVMNRQEKEFKLFLEKFSADSLFQIKRINFPVIEKSSFISKDGSEKLETTKIFRVKWKKISLKYRNEFGTREIDAFTQQFLIEKDKATVQIRGVNNGLYTDFIFKKQKNNWYLVEIDDFSN